MVARLLHSESFGCWKTFGNIKYLTHLYGENLRTQAERNWKQTNCIPNINLRHLPILIKCIANICDFFLSYNLPIFIPIYWFLLCGWSLYKFVYFLVFIKLFRTWAQIVFKLFNQLHICMDNFMLITFHVRFTWLSCLN